MGKLEARSNKVQPQYLQYNLEKLLGLAMTQRGTSPEASRESSLLTGHHRWMKPRMSQGSRTKGGSMSVKAQKFFKAPKIWRSHRCEDPKTPELMLDPTKLHDAPYPRTSQSGVHNDETKVDNLRRSRQATWPSLSIDESKQKPR